MKDDDRAIRPSAKGLGRNRTNVVRDSGAVWGSERGRRGAARLASRKLRAMHTNPSCDDSIDYVQKLSEEALRYDKKCEEFILPALGGGNAFDGWRIRKKMGGGKRSRRRAATYEDD